MRPDDVNPQTIVAILIAAHRHGNRELERDMRDRLRDDYGVSLTFHRTPAGKEVARA